MSVAPPVPTTGTTYETVLRVLEDVCGHPLTDITPDTSLFHQIGVDSTGVMHLLMCLSDELGVEFDVEQLRMRDFATVGTLTAFVDRETRS